MVLMWMRNQNALRWHFNVQRFREQSGSSFGCIERPPHVQNDALFIAQCNFDTIPADFVRSAVDNYAKFVQD